MGGFYLRFNKLIQQNPLVSKQQILNSVGEDEDLPDLHDEEDERIHLTPNGIVPRLFVWNMFEKHTRLKRMDCKKSKSVTQCTWMRFVCIFYPILIFLLYSLYESLSQAVTPWHFVERAPELSGLPFAEDMMKPWKSTGSS